MLLKYFYFKGDLMSEIFDKVRSVIAERLSIDESKITESSSFIEDLGADSLDTVELIMQLEEWLFLQIRISIFPVLF